MKRFSLSILCAVAAICAMAQDIIVTTDATRINAKIVEISAYDILYKQESDLDGPTTRLPLSNIVSILFEDGRVSVFNNDLKNPALYDKVVRQPLLPGVITKQKKTYFLTEDTQVTKMSEEAYLKFIENNCPEAWQSYQRGERCWSLGWRFFASGWCLEAVGVPVFFVGLKLQNKGKDGDPNSNYGMGMSLAGIIMMAGGGVCEVASIPLLSVGSKKRRKSYEVYNNCYYLQHPVKEETGIAAPVSLNLQANTNGFGLALKF